LFQTANKVQKISDQIVEQIRNAVLSGQFKPGDRVASEKELMSEFAVSKATLREALRVLEGMGLVEIRKGMSGGVFIAEVDMKTTIHSIINFLHFKTVSVKDITMIRYFLEPHIAQLAASRIKPEDIEKLEKMISEDIGSQQTVISREIGFHRFLARMTENPILILIMDFIDNILNDIKFQLKLGPEFYLKVEKAHRAILECLKQGDADGARREVTNDLIEVGYELAKLSGTKPFDPSMMERKDSSHQAVQSTISQDKLMDGALKRDELEPKEVESNP